MKHIIWLMLLMAGCWPECNQDDLKWCHCQKDSHLLQCEADGWWEDCDCYDNGGTGRNPNLPYDSDEGGTNYSSFLEYFPNCQESYIDDCNWDEIKIPCTNLCWRRCPAGQEWDGAACTGYPEYLAHETIQDMCKEYNPDYRFPTLEEVTSLTTKCYPGTFDYTSVNYCSPYQESALRFVIDPPWETAFDTWIGQLDWCIDKYGFEKKSCAWIGKFYIDIKLETEMNWLVGHGGYGSAMSGGMCVRNK